MLWRILTLKILWIFKSSHVLSTASLDHRVFSWRSFCRCVQKRRRGNPRQSTLKQLNKQRKPRKKRLVWTAYVGLLCLKLCLQLRQAWRVLLWNSKEFPELAYLRGITDKFSLGDKKTTNDWWSQIYLVAAEYGKTAEQNEKQFCKLVSKDCREQLQRAEIINWGHSFFGKKYFFKF